MPGILRWFEVVESDTSQLTPIEAAIDTMENMNRTLRTLVAEYSSNSNQNVNPLTMRLNGVLDAAVMGGTSKYQEVCLVSNIFTIRRLQAYNRDMLIN